MHFGGQQILQSKSMKQYLPASQIHGSFNVKHSGYVVEANHGSSLSVRV
jgi:hypothetical protein